MTATSSKAATSSEAATKSDSAFAPARWLGRVFVVVLIGFFTLFFVIPLVWILLAPTKSDTQLNRLGGESSLSFGSFGQLAENWNALVTFQHGVIFTWLGNSVLYTGVALVITLVVTIPAGYALGLMKFKLRRTLLAMTLMVMLIPNTALVLPIFLEINAVNLVGTPWAVILPFSFFPFGVYLTYIYFSTAISHELLDAARVDGAGEFTVFWRIAMPLAKPVIALVGFFTFVTNWNNYFLPFVMVQGRKSPIQVGLAESDLEHARVQPDQHRLAHRDPSPVGVGDNHFRCASIDRLPVLAAVPRLGPDRRCNQGVGRSAIGLGARRCGGRELSVTRRPARGDVPTPWRCALAWHSLRCHRRRRRSRRRWRGALRVTCVPHRRW